MIAPTPARPSRPRPLVGDDGSRSPTSSVTCSSIEAGAPLAIASGPWAPADVERRANAFAAGLLMPEEAVAAAVEDIDLYTLAGVRAVAQAVDASISATIARLHVLGHIDGETEDYLEDQLAPK